jgi:hypothetical protein
MSVMTAHLFASLVPSPGTAPAQGAHLLAKLLSMNKNFSHASCLLLKKQGGKFKFAVSVKTPTSYFTTQPDLMSRTIFQVLFTTRALQRTVRTEWHEREQRENITTQEFSAQAISQNIFCRGFSARERAFDRRVVAIGDAGFTREKNRAPDRARNLSREIFPVHPRVTIRASRETIMTPVMRGEARATFSGEALELRARDLRRAFEAIV